MIEAATFTVNGLQGALFLIAAILFAIAAVMAYMTGARWAAVVAAGLCLSVLAVGIVHS